MSRVDDDHVTPMEGGLKIKKETYSKNDENTDLESYVNTTDFKTLSKDIELCRQKLDAPTVTTNECTEQNKGISQKHEEKLNETLRGMRQKIDDLNTYKSHLKGISKNMSKRYGKVVQGLHNDINELSTVLTSLMTLNDDKEVSLPANDKEDPEKSISLDDSTGNEIICVPSLGHLSGTNSNSFNSRVERFEDNDELIKQIVETEYANFDRTSDIILFSTPANVIEREYNPNNKTPKDLAPIIFDKHDIVINVLDSIKIPTIFEYSSLSDGGVLVHSQNWIAEFMDYMDNYYDPNYRFIGLVFALNSCFSKRKASYVDKTSKQLFGAFAEYINEDLSISDIFAVFFRISDLVIPRVFNLLGFPLEYIFREKGTYDAYERSLLDLEYDMHKSKVNIFREFVEEVCSKNSEKLTIEFELYSSFIPRLKANFPLLIQQDDFERFCVGVSSSKKLKQHIKRLAKKIKVERFLFDRLLEQLKIYSMHLFICKVYRIPGMNKVHKDFGENFNYFKNNTNFYSSIVEFCYLVVKTRDVLESFDINDHRIYFNKWFSGFQLGEMNSHDISKLKMEAYTDRFSYVLSAKSLIRPVAVNEYTQKFFSIEEGQFMPLLLNIIIKKGYSFDTIDDVDDETRDRIFREAQSYTSKSVQKILMR